MGRRRGTTAVLACAVVLLALLATFVVDRRGLSSVSAVVPSLANATARVGSNGTSAASLLSSLRRRGGWGNVSAWRRPSSPSGGKPSLEESGGPSDPAEASCRTLQRHIGGRWEHEYELDPSSTFPAAGRYLPKELGWLRGEGSPSEWAQCVHSTDGTMYQGSLGNQCGACAVPGFRPSHSTWLPSGDGKSPGETAGPGGDDDGGDPPAIALVRRLSLRNQTLCIAGDSIDKQLYAALNRLLVRQGNLPGRHGYTVKTSGRIVEVNYTAISPTLGWVKGWMVMNDMPERTFTVWGPEGEVFGATVRFIKTYAWTPWNTLFMDECG